MLNLTGQIQDTSEYFTQYGWNHEFNLWKKYILIEIYVEKKSVWFKP